MINKQISNANGKTIIISAYRNVSIRYLVYGDLLDRLISSGLRIILLVNEKNIEFYKDNLKDKNIIIEPIFYSSNLFTLRSILGSVFNTYRLCTSPEGKYSKNHTVKLFINQYKKEWSSNLLRKAVFFFIYLVAKFASKSLIIRNFLINVESWIFKGKEYNFLFDKYKPSLLIVSSIGHMLDLYTINCAKRNNTKVMTIFHNWDGPTTKGYKANEIDSVIAWNEIMKNETINFQDIPSDKVYIGGCINYDLYFKKIRYFKNKESFYDYFKLDPTKKIILFAPGGIALWPKGLDILKEILEDVSSGRILNAQVLFRLHPNFLSESAVENPIKENIKREIDYMISIYGDCLKISIPEFNKLDFDFDLPLDDLKILSDILTYSDLLITQYSTLLIESSIFDLPAINSAIGDYRDYGLKANVYENATHIKTIMKYNAFDNVDSWSELRNSIKKNLKSRNAKSIQRNELVNDFFGDTKGKSSEIVSNHIIEFISKLN
jgi:hypothetical protein